MELMRTIDQGDPSAWVTGVFEKVLLAGKDFSRDEKRILTEECEKALVVFREKLASQQLSLHDENFGKFILLYARVKNISSIP
jgi:hypothetical protein